MSITSIFPVFNEDVLLKYRPFPAETSFLLLRHWHEIVGSFLFYTFIQLISPALSKKLVGKSYTSLNKRTKVNFDIHVVSMVQCIISIVILLPMWNHPFWQNRLEDPQNSILGYSPYGGFVSAASIGYFVWDLFVCVKYFSLFEIGFLFHAFAALYVFVSGLYPFCMPWIPAFLLFELSTPFVNINWFASRLPAGTFSDRTIVINGVLLLITFASVRIVWGLYAVTLVAADMFKVWDQLPAFLPLSILGLNLLLNVLNFYWFHKMVIIAKKKAKGKESAKQTAKEASDKIE